MEEKDIDFYSACPQIHIKTVASEILSLKTDFERKENVELSPDFQREYTWNLRQRSELIESILMGIPLPVMYFFQDDKGGVQVVDGKQRLTTVFAYLDNKFALTPLNILSDLKGKRFNDLDPRFQKAIQSYKFTINVVMHPTPQRIKLDIFDRLNRGGTRLNNQEMRNAIYLGKATQMLDELRLSKEFKRAVDDGVKAKFMKDRYYILRFLSFYLWKNDRLRDENLQKIEYKSDVDAFVAHAMKMFNRMDDSELEEIKALFKETMDRAYNILGPDAFRASNYLEGETRKKPISMALIDSIGYLMSHPIVETDKQFVINELRKLFRSGQFINAIITPVNSNVKVAHRFRMMDSILLKLAPKS